jgi:hypothetical protein
MLRLSKHIIDCKEYQEIKKLDGTIRSAMKKLALPSILKNGTYLIPVELVEKIDTMVETYAKERSDLVTAFINGYDANVAASLARLGSLGKPDEYTTVEQVQGAFYVRSRYVDFGIPVTLSKINKEIFEREAQKAEQSWSEASKLVQDALCAGLADLTDHLVERLSGSTDGKPKVFKASSIDNINEFISTFDIRNITNYEELKVVVDKAKSVLNGVAPSALRENSDLRKKVLGGMTAVKSSLDTMMKDRPKRVVSFKEEE